MTKSNDNHPTQRPRDVTFFIGPSKIRGFKRAYEKAMALYEQGDRSALDRILEFPQKELRKLVQDSPEEASLLKSALETQIGCEIGEFPTLVSVGYLRNTWTPILTIYIDRLKASDGSLLGHLVKKSHCEVIAIILRELFQAEWLCEWWGYSDAP